MHSPHGLRFSGMNMDPLSCWMTGAQNVALNLTVSPCDRALTLSRPFVAKRRSRCCWGLRCWVPTFLRRSCMVAVPVQLHHALFSHTGGYVLKPREMRSSESSYWPPARDKLHRVSIEVLKTPPTLKKPEARLDRTISLQIQSLSLNRRSPYTTCRKRASVGPT